MNELDAGAPVPPSRAALRSHAEVAEATGWLLRQAAAHRARRLTWLDPDFTTWPLGAPDVLDALTTWLQLPQRRLTVVSHGYAQIERQHPRFVNWRRSWAHAVDAWSPSEGVEVKLPSLLFDDGSLSLQVVDPAHGRGRLSIDERVVRQWRDETDALLQRCEAAFPVRHLGL